MDREDIKKYIKKNNTLYVPVIAFYCGGTERIYFGGGVYKYIKKKILENPNALKSFMISVGQFNDFKYNSYQFNLYLSKTLKEWLKKWSNKKINIVLFVDSGGYKFLTKKHFKIGNKNISVNSQKYIVEVQTKIGADVYFPLDYPLDVGISQKEKLRRFSITIKNTVKMLQILNDKKINKCRYIILHGFSREDYEIFFKLLFKKLEEYSLSEKDFDGIGIGSLVPRKHNGKNLIDLLIIVEELKEEYGLNDKFVHVFGISSSLVPIMVLLNIQSFDSSTPITSGRFGIKFESGLKRKYVNKRGNELYEIIWKNILLFQKEIDFIKKNKDNINKIIKRYNSNKKAKLLLEYLIKNYKNRIYS